MKISLIVVLFLFLLSLFSTVYKNALYSPKRIGKQGEEQIKKVLKSRQEEGALLSNLYFFGAKYSTEVDMVYINKTGIYVIESKNYQGAVYGNWNNRKWAHVVRKRKYQFYNPVMQNHTHVRAVAEAVYEATGKSFPIYSLIVFSNKTQLTVTPRKQGDIIICKQEGVQKCLNHKEKQKGGSVYITSEEMKNIKEILNPHAKTNFLQKRKHINYVSARIKAS